MKNLTFVIFIFIICGCSKDRVSNNNPFIPNVPVNYSIDLNLPQYNNLKFPSNGMLITDINAGYNGLIVFNTGSGYNAFDANCPNLSLSTCSRLTINGIEAICPCDNVKYDLFTGTSPGQKYNLKFYRVEASGNIIRIYN